ncbi:DUF2125 domain-containing protein [Loktanella sp. SALINAS62]|uniref:DUF2125 domain-containing protein n=1 Tax=Loktanella sp. SALINAS62 TaxID=2706124 RepID=UPI001B8B3EFB|nr:DUF2125 domain-containing protein [Loktanella sp. SALINAS62]MBS1302327.1 DUF2125 domain-containing protein [Loktanella sp. SALINAS62]
MTHFVTIGTTAACAAILSTMPAMADVTPQQVWQSWQDIIERTEGATVTVGALNQSADELIASDVVYTVVNDGTTSAMTVSTITLQDNGDGTVSVVLPDNIPLRVITNAGEDLDMYLAQTDAETQVSGAPDAMNYTVSAAQYVIGVNQMTDIDGNPVPLELRVALNGLSGTTDQTTGDTVNVVYDLTADSLDLLVDGVDRSTGDELTVSGKIDGLELDADVILPEADVAGGPGMTGSGGYAYTGAAFIFSSVGDQMTADGTATTGPVALTFAVDPAGLRYDAAVQDLAAALRGSELPMPFEMQMDAYNVGVTMPLGPTEAPAPFGFQFGMDGVTVNDEAWAMVDPGGMIPRDPASLTIDIDGTAQLTQSLMDTPENTQMQGFPGRLLGLNINEISLNAAGALLNAVGAFTFNENGPQTAPGIPAAQGEATITLEGANQLIDSLIAMGVVPQDQAMMGRMMLGMFTSPVGDDTLETVIKVTPDGQVLANGQRIR